MPPSEFVVKTVYWFFLYGCIGWGVEVVYAAIKEHKLVNRGFLCGPICPIYGFGMVIVLVALTPLAHSLPVLFVGGALLTSALELAAGWILKKVFHTSWWDYSDVPFNLGGYICLKFSLAWGVAVVAEGRTIGENASVGPKAMLEKDVQDGEDLW